MEVNYKDIVAEEVEAYLCMNGEVGAWGESMRDSVGVDAVCEMIRNGHGLTITPEIVEEVERQLLISNIE